MRLYKRVIVLCVALLLVVGAAHSVNSVVAANVPTAADYTTLPTIIIDPGHGGVDGGAVGVGDIVEKEINLAICLTLRDLFTVNGFQVMMTRDSDISIHDEGITSVRGQKTSDLHNRLAITEQYPDALFLSIHQNKFSDAGSRGTQLFYGPNNEQSEKLAELMQANFIARLQPENKRAYKKAGKNLFLMYTAKCPAVLVECGFLSNAEEARLLTDPEYQSKVAFVIFSSVMEFLELDTPVYLMVEEG